MEKVSGPRLGVTLYSFTNSWGRRLYDLESLMAKVSALGLGPEIEIVGFQSLRTYPEVTPEFAKEFRDMLDKYELVANCLGANVDYGIRKDRLMTTDEAVDYIERQINTAQVLGFSVVRNQFSEDFEILDRIIPIAERAGVHVANEVHAPLNLEHPLLAGLLEYLEKKQTSVLGIIPDFSGSMLAPPEVYWESLRQKGASEGLIDAMKTIWKSEDQPPKKFGQVAEAAEKFAANPNVVSRLNTAITMFGKMPAEDWREVLPYARHIHGKFYGVTESGVEPSIPYPELMALLKDVGYQGTISAEWEGHAFTGEPIGFDQVQAWRKMCTRLLVD